MGGLGILLSMFEYWESGAGELVERRGRVQHC